MLRWALCVLVFASCIERKSKKADPESEPTNVSLSRPTPAGAPASPVAVRSQEPSGPRLETASIVVRLPSEPRHLNPLLAGDTIAVQVALGDVYESLLQRPRPGARPTPHLATKNSQSADGLSWVFELREGVTFHDGTTLSVADVEASFALVQNVVGPLRGEFDDLESVTVTGPRTIAFRFSESRPERADAFASVPIVSAKSFQDADVTTLNLHTASQSPNGTGPLRLQRTSADEIEFVRNPSYWGPSAKAGRIVYRVIADRTRALKELRSGQIDIVLGLPVDEAIAAVQSDASLELVQRSLPAYTAAVFNTENPRLHRGARSALSRSFDRESILQELFRGYAEVAIGPFLRHGDREAPREGNTDFVLESAVADLHTAFSNAKPQLRLLVPRGSRTMERLADIWATDVRDAVDINVQKVDFGALLARVRSGDFEIALLSFTTSAETDLYSLFHSSEVGRGNLSRLAEPAVDALLETLRRSLAEEERIETSHILQHQLLRFAPYAFLTTDVRLGIVRKDIAGVGDTAPAEGARFYGRLAKATP